MKISWDHPSVVIHLLQNRSAFDSSAIYPINKGTRFTKSNRHICFQLRESSFLSAILFPRATCTLQATYSHLDSPHASTSLPNTAPTSKHRTNACEQDQSPIIRTQSPTAVSNDRTQFQQLNAR
jgi:hypothetical protein